MTKHKQQRRTELEIAWYLNKTKTESQYTDPSGGPGNIIIHNDNTNNNKYYYYIGHIAEYKWYKTY